MAGDDFWMALSIRYNIMSGKGSYGRGYWLLMSLIILLNASLVLWP